MIRAILKFIFNKIMGWKVEGDFPEDKKAIVLVAPHTSWFDVPIGIFSRIILQRYIRFIGKKELFRPPLGWLLKALGGAPVDRTKSTNMVQATADLINSEEEFLVAITPEGTRRKVKKFKTGFYYIAKLANIPIIPVGFDYARKTVFILPKYEVTDDFDADIANLWKMYEPFRGRNPEGSIGDFS